MGAGQDYFDELTLDYTEEVPDEATLETRRRLLYLLKAETNGTAMILGYVGTTPSEIVAVSPEFTQLTGYTLEDIQTMMEAEETFFVPASQPIAAVHASNNLTAPWVGQIVKKNEATLSVVVQGVSFKVDGLAWRALTFESYP